MIHVGVVVIYALQLGRAIWDDDDNDSVFSGDSEAYTCAGRRLICVCLWLVKGADGDLRAPQEVTKTF